MAAPQQPPPILTDFAKLYGVATVPPWNSQGKSGLTPVSPPNSTTTAAEIRDRDAVASHQRGALVGFTSLQLQGSGCLSKSTIAPNDLHNPIHAIYMRDQWMPSSDPLPAPFNGVWSGGDTVVWNAIRPMLQLASRIIDSSDMWIWFDALFKGPRTNLPKEECALDGGTYKPLFPQFSFDTRKPHEVLNDPESQRHHFVDFAKYVQLQIVDRIGAHGSTRPVWDRIGLLFNPEFQKSFTMALSRRSILLLLRSDISPSERLMQEYFVANVLVHETCHALWAYAETHVLGHPTEDYYDGEEIPVTYEPVRQNLNLKLHSPNAQQFFRDEAMSECGWSAEKAIYGGITRPMFNPPLLLMCMYIQDFVDYIYFGEGLVRDLKRFRFHSQFEVAAKPITHVWSVQVRYMEAIQREDFWIARVRPFHGLFPEQILGVKHVKTAGTPDRTLLLGADYRAWLDDEDCPVRPPGPSRFWDIRKTSMAEFQKSELVRQRREAVRKGLVANIRMIAGEEIEEEGIFEKMDEGQDF